MTVPDLVALAADPWPFLSAAASALGLGLVLGLVMAAFNSWRV